jgi:hypothetical protein
MSARARITVLSFTLLIILASQVSLSFAPNFSTETIAASGTIVYPYAGSATMLKHLVVYPYTIDDQLAAFIASHFNLVDFGVGSTIGWQKIKQANPNIIMITYQDALYMNNRFNDWAMVNSHEDWFLHDMNGNRIAAGSGNYAMDISSSGWRNYTAGKCVAQLNANPLVDGIFLDDVADSVFFNWSPWGGVPIAASVKTNWDTNMEGLIQVVKAAIGNKLLVANSFDFMSVPNIIKYCDGQMIEGFVHNADATTKGGLYEYRDDALTWIGFLETLSRSGKIIMVKSDYIPVQNPTAADIEQAHKLMLYCLSCFLLGYSGKANFGFQSLHYDYTGQQGYWEEMNASIGNPNGPKYQVTGNLYARDFDSARVFVNVGSSGSYNITYAGKNYTLGPYSGLIAK